MAASSTNARTVVNISARRRAAQLGTSLVIAGDLMACQENRCGRPGALQAASAATGAADRPISLLQNLASAARKKSLLAWRAALIISVSSIARFICVVHFSSISSVRA